MKDNKIKTIVITGASDGLGAEAARYLHALGHNVVIVGRNPLKTRKLAEELNIPYHIADYARLGDVVRLARELSAYPEIDVLANNAGAMQNTRAVSEDGYELTFQVNVLAQFLLVKLLAEKLCACRVTVIQTASIAAKMFGNRFDVNDIENENAYTSTKAYGESKLCDILFTRELAKRYGDKGISAVAFQPGIPRTNFACEGPTFFKIMYHSPFKYLFTCSVKSAAKRLVRLATGLPGVDFECGKTYSYKKQYDCRFNDDSAAASLWDYCDGAVSKFIV